MKLRRILIGLVLTLPACTQNKESTFNSFPIRHKGQKCDCKIYVELRKSFFNAVTTVSLTDSAHFRFKAGSYNFDTGGIDVYCNNHIVFVLKQKRIELYDVTLKGDSPVYTRKPGVKPGASTDSLIVEDIHKYSTKELKELNNY